MRLPNPRTLWWLGFGGFAHLLGEPLAWARFLFLFFFAPLVAGLVGWLRRPRPDPVPETLPALPLPGPAERSGAVGFLLRFFLCELLSLVSRNRRRQVALQRRGEAEARRRIGGREPEPESHRLQAEYSLPFAGEWLVFNGGPTRATSHSWDILSQRFAYDFVVADDAGRRHRGDGTRLEDYLAYGAPILAPADGEVVAVVEGVRDAPRVGTGWTDWRAPAIGGNSVTIRHAEGEYSFLAHLVPGSVQVRPGERVRRGQEVGRCGNSGNSTEPHLHFQLQDHPDHFRAVGLPVRFAGVALGGSGEPFDGSPSAGMRVRPFAAVPAARQGGSGSP